VQAVRIGPTGAILDKTPLAVTPVQTSTDVGAAWDGTNFVVVWPQWLSINNGSDVDYDLYGVRLSASGTRVDAADFPIRVGPGTPSNPQIAAGPSGVLAVWQETLSHLLPEPDILGSRIDNGAGLDNPSIVVSTGPSAKDHPAVASNGSDYYVAFRDDRGNTLTAMGERRGTSGTALQTADTVISSTPSNPVVASTSTSYVAAWLGGARRIGFDGIVMDAADIALPPSAARGTMDMAIACAQSA
jgi:hypothetical protein